MKFLYVLLICGTLLLPGLALAGTGVGTVNDVNQYTLTSGEDQTNNVIRAEGQFSYKAPVTADAQVKASAGFLHCIWITQNDAAPTAGTIIIYDSTAESGTQVFNWTLTTAVFNPIVLCPDIVMTTGIYIGFTTTADVNVSVSYR